MRLKVTCPRCRAAYRVDAARLDSGRYRIVRCGRCGHRFQARRRLPVPKETAETFLAACLVIDLEVGRDNRIHRIGALFGEKTFERKGRFSPNEALAALDRFGAGAARILGHNIVSHDLPILAAQAPTLDLLGKPVVDTLYLSPLAFPENPYHRLVKDYKLVRDAVNNPVADARLSATLFRDQWESFAGQARTDPDLLRVYRYAFAPEGDRPVAPTGRGMADLFARIDGVPDAPVIDPDTALRRFVRFAGDRICTAGIEETVRPLVMHPNHRTAIAYALAWLRVAGGNSVIPPWVRHRFPEVTRALKAVRDKPCDNPDCGYCRENHNPARQLRRYFGFKGFRTLPDGTPLQERIVKHGMADQPLLAVLPTGFGKSLCFQLPALIRHARRGLLTVVISPLLSLMKDQKESLERATGTVAAVAIYSLLTGPERGAALEGVRMGDIGVLYISPEQLRNRSVREALKSREIGAWVFDEAHCLSKWGHDFRPDYLYAARFIRELAELQGETAPPVTCLTATARIDVIEEIRDHFRDQLGQRLERFLGGHERDNLQYAIEPVGPHTKHARIAELLTERLGDGSAIVYCATRRETEAVAKYLQGVPLSAETFHAGMSAPDKRRVQDAFISGEIPVICATNAFGMGIDKPDVRLVIHADIPGSLENYLQEAGRAGRDLQPAECILLYDREDVETQFGLAALSEVRKRDIAQILRGIRRRKRNPNGESVVTPKDLLRDTGVAVSFDPERQDADTKVKTAVAWLERAGFLERNENRTWVIQGRPRFQSMAEAGEKLDRLNLSDDRRRTWEAVLRAILRGDPDEGINADDLYRELSGLSESADRLPDSRAIMDILHQMVDAELITEGINYTAFVRPTGPNNARTLLSGVCMTETRMLEVLRTHHPDDDPEQWPSLSVRGLAQQLRDGGIDDANPERLKALLRSLARDGTGFAGGSGSIRCRHLYGDQWGIRLLKSWDTIEEISGRRQAVAWAILNVILEKAMGRSGGDILVSFASDELADGLRRDLTLHHNPVASDKLSAAIERGLLFLHEHRVIILQKGLAVFRQALTIRLLPTAKGRRYTKGEYAALDHHYAQRRFQIHVINEYVRLGLERISRAQRLVTDYFTLKTEAFIRRCFPDRRKMLEMATSEATFKAIVESLKHPVQEAIVASDMGESALVLAGPGSGKTRVVVHRCAYLLRVKRVPSSAILMLCFNLAAATAVRRRLRALVGPDAAGVAVLTYHALAMRLTGTSFAALRKAHAGQRLDEVIREATALLTGEKGLPGFSGDETRDRLLGGYSHILVDEYQDIDGDQYELISAIAGRTRDDPTQKCAILAVGDDDQSIYGFRNASVEYIRRFKADYAARVHYLVESYRGTGHIIAAANALIDQTPDRMKTGYPIRVNRGREGDPAGGVWASLDPVGWGTVQRITVADAGEQAAALVAEIRRLISLRPDLDGREIAVLARNGMGCDALAAARTALSSEGMAFSCPLGQVSGFPIHRVREIADALDDLSRSPNTLHRASELINRVGDGPDLDNPWLVEVRRLLEDWQEETGDAILPTRAAIDFIYESLMARRREHRLGHGIHLGTAHGAKGLEMDHVFILDGDWRAEPDPVKLAEERRLYYVAMTRGKQTLTLFYRRDRHNPHVLRIDPDSVMDRTFPSAGNPPPVGVRYDVLGMGDLYIDYAGGFPAGAGVHGAVGRLRTGAPARFSEQQPRHPFDHAGRGARGPAFATSPGALEGSSSDSGKGDRSGPGPADRRGYESDLPESAQVRPVGGADCRGGAADRVIRMREGRLPWVHHCHQPKNTVFGERYWQQGGWTMHRCVFISHSSRDYDFVDRIRDGLAAKGIYNLVGSRELRSRGESTPAILSAIEAARAFIVVISPDAFNSAWVAEEARHAATVRESRSGDLPIIPLLREGVEMGALKWLFSGTALAIRVGRGSAGVRRVLPQIVTAIDSRPLAPMVEVPSAPPVSEMVLEMRSPTVEARADGDRDSATAELSFVEPGNPPDPIECREPFLFAAPLGPAEMADLDWYLTRYVRWPSTEDGERAAGVARRMPEWGRRLFRRVLAGESCVPVREAWGKADPAMARRFTVFIDSRLVVGSSLPRQEAANEAAVRLLRLPWELLHDGRDYLLCGARPVPADRPLPLRPPRDITRVRSPIRVLRLRRPTTDIGGILTGGLSGSEPPVQVPLDEPDRYVEVTTLFAPTVSALKAELDRKQPSNTPYHAVHVDGLPLVPQGGAPWIDTAELAEVIRAHRIHLFFSRSLILDL